MSKKMTSKEEWLKLPKIVRLWRLLTCRHNWTEANFLGQVRNREYDEPGWRYVVNVYECWHCRQEFINSGVEDMSYDKIRKRGEYAEKQK